MRVRVLFFLLILAVSAPPAIAAPAYFVAKNGNDTWSGSLAEPNTAKNDGPFATLTKAQQALRSHGRPDGLPEGAAVYVREGLYYLPATLHFGKEDSGNKDAPVLWQAYKNEKVVISGAMPVTDFKPYKDQILRAEGIECRCAAAPAPNQLFFKGERQTLARWPNKGEGDVPGGGWAFVSAAVTDDKMKSFKIAPERMARWTNAKDILVSIWPNYNWYQTIAKVSSLNAAGHTVTLDGALPYSIEPGRRLFFENLLEELDAPGEWYYDSAAKTIYFWPPSPIDNNAVQLANVANAISLDNARYINIIGLTVEGTQSDGIVVKDSEDCLIGKCSIENTGGFGITVNGGQRVRVLGNDISHTGQGGIVLNGGDRKTLNRGGHQAVNNHIHHYAELYKTYQTGINVDGVGNLLAHNLIHDAPHMGIYLTGNDHVIEFNEIHHVCMEASDNGAFYMGRDWTQRGNLLRDNVIHDVYGFGLSSSVKDDAKVTYETPYQAWGVYLDDCSSGTTITNNIFYRVPLCGVMIGGGRDNLIDNNVFVECIPALHVDARWESYPWDLMNERLNAMDYKKSPYSERYPELLKMGDDPRKPAHNRFTHNLIAYKHDDIHGLSSAAPSPESAVVYDLDQFDPENTVIDHNLIDHDTLPVRINWHAYKQNDSAKISWDAWRDKGFDSQSVLDQAKFVDAEHDNYHVRYNSKALSVGFKSIPETLAGLYQDEFRASWPPPVDTRKDGVERKTYTVDIAAP